MVSPLHAYPAPPLSHSNHQSMAASEVRGPLGGLLSPPESRRTSGDEKEPQRAPTRQSLPSIHEALGSEQSLSFSAPPPPPPPSAPVSAPQPYHPPSTAASPSDQRSRTFSSDIHASQGPPNPFSHPRSPFMNPSASSAPSAAAPPPPPPPPPPPAPSDSLPRPSFSEPRSSFSAPQHNPKLPTLHPIRTTQSPPAGASRPNPPYSSYQQQQPQPQPAYEASTPHSATAMNPQYSHGYSQYPPSNYPLSAPPPGPPNSAYPATQSTYSAPPRAPYSSWRDNSEMARLEEKKINRSSLAPYGESVKRHLESFDLEASLNEVSPT